VMFEFKLLISGLELGGGVGFGGLIGVVGSGFLMKDDFPDLDFRAASGGDEGASSCFTRPIAALGEVAVGVMSKEGGDVEMEAVGGGEVDFNTF
jgi:hypothetical protein